ncbi:MAG: hypothetical protein OXG04_26270 [Acidobacteria bacterium]|nr:hypothetical protein [Acidobacteriota bacterium]
MTYLAKRQFRYGKRVVRRGDTIELAESAARYLKLHGWIVPAPQPKSPPPEPSAARRRRAG